MITQKKRGRKRVYHQTAWDSKVDGLSLLADGRWRVSSAPGHKAVKFTADTEEEAVHRALKILSSRQGNTVRIPKAVARKGDDEGLRQAIAVVVKPARDLTALTGTFLPPDFVDELKAEQPVSTSITIELDGDDLVLFRDEVQEAAFFGWFRKVLHTRKEWLAQKSGVPGIAWLQDAQRPEDSPKLADIGKLYQSKPGLTPEEGRRANRFWMEFVRTINLTTVREIKHEHAEAYEQKLSNLDLGPKSIKHSVWSDQDHSCLRNEAREGN